jgi:hypothetical protein
MISSTIADVIEQARRDHWCTKRHCATCEPTSWCSAVQELAQRPERFARDLARLPVHAWYDLPELGGAIYHAFSVLPRRDLVDQVLQSWLTQLEGHVRIADAVTFYVIREGLSSERLRHEWLRRSESMAVETKDPSLLETLLYALGDEIVDHPQLLRAAELMRRGHAPLDRALKRVAESAPPSAKPADR